MDDARAIITRGQQDPSWWFRNVLADDLWLKQIQIAEAVRDHKYVAVPSCHSSGKSYVSGRVVPWFLFCFPGSKIITTAPTERQIQHILWSEIGSAVSRSKYPLGGKLTTMRLEVDKDWFAMGFTASDYDPNRFQGFHAPYLLIVVDEAAGISPVIDEQIDSLMAGGEMVRRLEIGNPVEAGTPFERHCESTVYTTMPISAFDTPNFTETGIKLEHIKSGAWRDMVPKRLPNAQLITPEWVAERLELWGEDSDAWKSRVLGQFPETVEGAYYGEYLKTAREEGRITSLAMDPAKPVYTASDLGMRDPTSTWFWQFDGNWLNFLLSYEETGSGAAGYADLMAHEREERGWHYGRHFSPPTDSKVRDWSASGIDRIAVLRDLGVIVEPVPRLRGTERGERNEGIDLVRQILPRCRFDPVGCKDGLVALKSYHRKKNKATGALADDPEHDWASHYADAFRYAAIAIRRGIQQGPRGRPKPRVGRVT